MAKNFFMFLALAFGVVSQAAVAEDVPEITISLKDHKFTPEEVQIVKGKPVILVITNLDTQADEFEMHQPAIEKVVPPGGTVKVRLRALEPGTFPFAAEFHADTAKGMIVSK